MMLTRKRAGPLDLAEHPADNDVAVGGQAALAAARHEFGAALRLAEEALRINPFQAGALAILGLMTWALAPGSPVSPDLMQ